MVPNKTLYCKPCEILNPPFDSDWEVINLTSKSPKLGMKKPTYSQSTDQFVLQIWPNPKENDMINIQIENIDDIPAGRAHGLIYNSLGQQILSFPINSLEPKINCSNYPKGVYYVQILIKNELKTEKLIVE